MLDTNATKGAGAQPPPGPRILVVEDDAGVRTNLLDLLENEGMRAVGADDGRAAIELARSHSFSLILCDVRMPEMTGFDVLREVRAIPGTRPVPFVFLSGATERDHVREGMALGADDYLTKPFTRNEVLSAIRARLGRAQQIAEGAVGRAFGGVVVEDPNMVRMYEQVDRAAGSILSILVLGETGVGKEVLARYIHDHSPRSQRPFVPINCAAISDGLIESELFGHERGAYTGASSARAGLLESAAGGTVFLDEVGELPPSVQVKLLRVLEDRRVYRVGGRTSLPLDVRFVAATNRDLDRAVADGAFRSDLLYRLNGFTVTIPPLRHRAREIVPLALEFIRTATGRYPDRVCPVLSAEAIEALVSYPFPGNVRELKNAMERAVALCDRGRIEVDHLPSSVLEGSVAAERTAAHAQDRAAPKAVDHGLRGEVSALERKRIVEALERCGGNQTAAAAVLGISRRTLVTRLSTFALPRPRKRPSEEAAAR